MKNVFRGGAILSVVCMVVVLIYAQTTAEKDLDKAKDSQSKIENNNNNNNNFVSTKSGNLGGNAAVSSGSVSNDDKESDKKSVTKTASVRAVGAGASRGSFTATAYCLKGRTAMGHGVRRGIIAADPRVLKLGSTVVVKAGAWSGTYLVSDTGGKIKGKRLDIWVPGCSEARKFGRRTVQVFSPR